MSFHFPGFTTVRQFNAIESDYYSLRNMVEVNKTKIESGNFFICLLTSCLMRKMEHHIGVL